MGQDNGNSVKFEKTIKLRLYDLDEEDMRTIGPKGPGSVYGSIPRKKTWKTYIAHDSPDFVNVFGGVSRVLAHAPLASPPAPLAHAL